MNGNFSEELAEIQKLPLPSKFQSLKDNAEKIRFSYKLLKEKYVLPTDVKPEKSDKKSLEARNLGNFYFKERNYVEALKFYNKSLCCAPSGSENLAISYANRSAVYLNLGFYDFCLANIECALKGNYPQKLVAKLNQRKTECLEQKKKHTDAYLKLKREKSDIRLSGKAHKKVPGMHEGLDIACSMKYGRHVVAKQNFYPGEVIVVEKPFVKSLLSCDLLEGSEYSRCTNCLKSEFYQVFPCNFCTKAMFCSEKCREDAIFHEFECRFFGAKIDYLILRSALLLVTTFKDELKELLPSKNSLTVFDENYDPKRKGDQLKVLLSHATFAPQISANEEFQISNNCALIWHLLDSSSFKEAYLPTKDLEDAFLTFLFDFGVISQFYSHSLLTMQKTPEDKEKVDGAFSPQKYGTGLLPISSLLNHSCAPNVTRMGNDDAIVIVVRRHIKPGEQIFDSYGPHHLNQKARVRQEEIKKKYSFDCSCEACENDYGLLNDLEMEDIVEFFPLCAGIMKIMEYDKTWAEKAYPQSKKFLEKFGEKYPAYEVCAAQIIMIHCISILMIKTPMELQFKSVK
ncbi:SET and MYND domain-containing protein 4-like [Culicoides brevitarsis]|uniref:SET and MYND domain-containing protein 4-like n=1 Tax=Culicoides brevitarsis TaxID=469753 RepID=UPI00307C1E2D